MRLLVSVFGPEGMPAGSQVCEPGQPLTFHVASPYLVSAGQNLNIGVSVFDADAMVLMQTGPVDATHLNLVQVPVTWDVSFIPSTRLLADILAEAIQHGVDHPTHGWDCACQDNQVREIRLQVSKALPPDGRKVGDDWATPIQERLNAKARVRAILNQVVRNL